MGLDALGLGFRDWPSKDDRPTFKDLLHTSFRHKVMIQREKDRIVREAARADLSDFERELQDALGNLK